VDKEAELCRSLSDRLLALDRSIHEIQLRETRQHLSPLDSAPLDF
jgi:hypothetical protein